MSMTTAIRKMVAAGLTYEQALIAADVFEQEDEDRKAARREGNRVRQQRHRSASRVTSVTERDERDPLDKEGFPHTPSEEIKPQDPPIVPPSRTRFGDPAITLQAVTDPVTARNFADHCAQRRPKLTEQSAAAVVRVCEEGRDKRGWLPTEMLKFAMGQGWAAGFGLDWFDARGFGKGKGKRAPTADTDWADWCSAFFADGTWKDPLGPRPGEPGCRAPPEIVEQARKAAA